MKRVTALGLVVTLGTIAVAVVWLFPLLWAVSTSLKQEMQTLAAPPVWFPNPVTFESYANVLAESALVRWYFNSIFTGLIITLLVLLLGILCAYAISQLDFPGKNILFWSLLAGFMLPFESMIVPLFMLMNKLGQVNTFAGIILPQLIAPVVIIVFKQFFDQVPRELRDAAVIDGAGEFRILFNIYLPINLGITWALAIVTFIAAWNNFFWPFIIATSTEMMTIPVGITQVQSAYGIAYAQIMAVAVLAGLPVVIAFLLFQRRVTEGMMVTSGLKG